MIYNKIPVKFDKYRVIIGPTINYQYDVKQYLVISGIEGLPEYFEVDFCNDGDDSTITITGSSEGVPIPDEFLLDGRSIKAYIVVHGEEEGASETRYEITIPVRNRPLRTDIQPTPAEQLQIDSLVETMESVLSDARDFQEDAERNALKSEGFAVGEQDGVEVQSGSPYFENNAKFYSEVAQEVASEGGWVHFYIDDLGDLHYVKTPNAELVFKLVNGDLIVTV